MKITRNHEDLKITLPKYKITVKPINRENNSYQYSCILPPVLCSFFNIEDTSNKEDVEDYSNLLMFYEYELSNYIMSGTTFYKALKDNHEHTLLNSINSSFKDNPYYAPKPELVEYCNNNPINYKIYDKIRYEHQYTTTVYKLKNSNNYRVTLPNKLFKHYINPYKNNYIIFTINTQNEDLLYNKGTVNYTVVQELKE